MKNIVVSLISFLSLPVLAQEKPTIEVFGGYSYTRLAPDNFVRRENLHGGQVSFTLNNAVRNFMGFTAEVSGYTGANSVADVTAYYLMAGPRFAREGKRVTWFVQSLYGASRITTVNRNSLGAVNLNQTSTKFAFAPGGAGLDVKINERVAIRLFQADLLSLQRDYPTPALSVRVSTGVVIRWGK